MTVGELIEVLQDMNPDSEVRWAAQPAWPFEYAIENVVVVRESHDPDDEEGVCDLEPVVYLVEGEQLGYLPQYVCDEIGW
jgi:hypothetical protein